MGLTIGTALPGLADPGEPGNMDKPAPGMVRGSVISLGEESFVIQSGEEALTLTVNGETRYFKASLPRGLAAARQRMELKCQNQEGTEAMAPVTPVRLKARGRVFQAENGGIPGPRRANLKRLHPFGEEVTFGDIDIGGRIVVQVADGDNQLAKRVLIIEPATCSRLRGTISDVSPADITIEPADGSEAVTLEYNSRTMFILRGTTRIEPGQSACAVYDSDSMVARRVTAGMPPLEMTE